MKNITVFFKTGVIVTPLSFSLFSNYSKSRKLTLANIKADNAVFTISLSALWGNTEVRI